MTIKHIDEDGNEIIAYTQEEVDARAAEAAKAKEDELVPEIEKLKKVSAEKTEHFKKLNEMTEEERQAHSVNEINILKRNEMLEGELATIKETLTQKETREKNEAKENAFTGICGEDADLRKSIEDNYAVLAGMPETTPSEIKARAEKAATLAGITVDKVNPLYVNIHGEAPTHKEGKEFVETDKGKDALELAREASGFKTE